MKKQFNITGICIPDKHWAADVSGKIASIMAMVEAGDYFVIHRPRQFGKTTTLFLLKQELIKKDSFIPLKISFEGIDTPTYQSHQLFIETFLGMIKKDLTRYNQPQLSALMEQETGKTKNFFQLGELLEKLNSITKPIVLMIDEVDNASNNQLFLDFLGMLRNKYLEQAAGEGKTFHSVILAGVHDIKSLKSKIRPGETQQFNSPWNIAAPFDLEMELNVSEIASMLKEYGSQQGVEMDGPAIAEQIFYYTSGYPFLVSYICKLMDERILPTRTEKAWHKDDIHLAVSYLLKERNTNFDSLIKNLENNPQLYDFIHSITVAGESYSFHLTDNLISKAKTYGMLAEEKGVCKIHNKIYEQFINDHMTLKIIREERVRKISHYNITSNFTRDDNSLDFEKVLLKFQEFMREQYDSKDRDFLERNGRLVFQAFLKPIINGSGFDFKEAQISEERRLDMVVTWGTERYIVELKIWRGPKAHQNGLRQLTDYLVKTHSNKGYLIIFHTGKTTPDDWTHQTITIDNKEIFMIRV